MAQNVTVTPSIVNATSNNQIAVSSSSNVQQVTGNAFGIKGTDWWIRVVLGVELYLTDALLHILHNYDNDPTYTGLTDDEVQLYNQMVTFQKNYKKRLSKVIYEDQWNTLCPSSGRSDSSTWDITLLIVVIRYCTDLPSPQGGWEQKSPHQSDTSKAAFVLRSRKFRNDIKHGSIHDISTEAQFTFYWTSMDTLLKGLQYAHMTKFYELETGTLNMYTSEMEKVLKRVEDVKNHSDDEITSLKNHFSELRIDHKRLENTVNQHLKSKNGSHTTSIYWNVYQNVANFTGREDVFAEIENQFSSPNETCDHNTVVIHGLGGVGKTEVAANYAKCHKDSYDNIIWLDCENIHDSVKELFTSYCSNNGQSSITAYLDAIYTTLKDTKCLFILDNVEKYPDTDAFFKNVGCFTFKPNFLMTTQRTSWDHSKFQTIDLLVFSKEESFSFMKSAFPSEGKESIFELVAVLNCFPLALQQARAYIQKHKISIHNYAKHFREHNEKILDVNLQNFGASQYSKTLLTVWNLAFRKIKSDETSLAILGIMACMDGKRINKNTFLYHKLINEDEIKLNEVIDILTEYSLIQVRNTEKYTILSMHTLVQHIVKSEVLENGLDYLSETIQLLVSIRVDTLLNDVNNLWYVHAKFILFESNKISRPQLYDLAVFSMVPAYNNFDNDVINHIINLLADLSNLIEENVNTSMIFHYLHVVVRFQSIRMEWNACKKTLADGYKLLEKYYTLENKHKYYLACFEYYIRTDDQENIKRSYSKIQDLSFFNGDPNDIPSQRFMILLTFSIGITRWNPDLYYAKLSLLKMDFYHNKVILKDKTELLDLINEPINILASIIDMIVDLHLIDFYFHCILMKIEIEIDHGEDKEKELKKWKENVKCHFTNHDFFDSSLFVTLQAKNHLNKGEVEKSLDILNQYKKEMLEKMEISSPFEDNQQKFTMRHIDCCISLVLLKQRSYKEACVVLTSLSKNEACVTLLGNKINLRCSISNIMCNKIEAANEIMNQIPLPWIASSDSYIMLHNYLCCYMIKHQEFNNLRNKTPCDKQKLNILLQECVSLRKSLIAVCEAIIYSTSFSTRTHQYRDVTKCT